MTLSAYIKALIKTDMKGAKGMITWDETPEGMRQKTAMKKTLAEMDPILHPSPAPVVTEKKMPPASLPGLENMPPLPFGEAEGFQDDREYTVAEIGKTRGIQLSSVRAGLRKIGIYDYSRKFTGKEVKAMGFGQPMRGRKGR